MHFDLIDQVIEQTPQTIRAVKCVTVAEEYLLEHFPGFPVLPGVMMLESLVQAAARLVEGLEDGPIQPLIVTQVRNVKYAAMVRPGQCLEVHVTLRGREGDCFEFVGNASVEGQTAVSGRFKMMPAPETPAEPVPAYRAPRVE